MTTTGKIFYTSNNARTAVNVCVLGDINADVTTDLAAFPSEGDDSEITHMAWCSGGAGANAATALASLGAHVHLLGRVGIDPAANIALQAAHSAGVQFHLVQRSPSEATGVCIAAISPGGQRTFLSFRGANVHLDGSLWSAATFNGVHALHICAHSLLQGAQQQAALRAIELAHAANVVVSLDLCLPTIRRQRALINELLPYVTLLCMNEDELHLLQPGRQTDTALAQLVNDGASLVVLKRSGAGCTAITASERLDLSAIDVDVCDTNGCGDAFVAGFLWAYLQGEPLLGCAALGNLLGGVTATHVGAANVSPMRDVVDTTLAQQAAWPGRYAAERLLLSLFAS